MHYISQIGEYFIEEPYAGKPHVRFCGGYHDIGASNDRANIMVSTRHNNIREQVLHIKCPEVLFPYTSRQIADITRDGGFPPMMIGLVNFAEIYQKRHGVANDDKKPAANGETVNAEVIT